MSHFDTENFEASVTKYLGTQFNGYTVIYEESATDYDSLGKWFYIEFGGNNGQTATQHPRNHVMVHIRTRGETCDADMVAMTRLVINALKDKSFDLYDVQTDGIIGKLYSTILREFPRESARQANSVRGFNRSVLVQLAYGKVGVVYV